MTAACPDHLNNRDLQEPRRDLSSEVMDLRRRLAELEEERDERESETLRELKRLRSLAGEAKRLRDEIEDRAAELKAKRAALALIETRMIAAEDTPLYDAAFNPHDASVSVLIEHGAPPGAVGKLKNAGLNTMRELGDHSSEHDGIDVQGIGPSAAAKIADACAKFWASAR